LSAHALCLSWSENDRCHFFAFLLFLGKSWPWVRRLGYEL